MVKLFDRFDVSFVLELELLLVLLFRLDLFVKEFLNLKTVSAAVFLFQRVESVNFGILCQTLLDVVLFSLLLELFVSVAPDDYPHVVHYFLDSRLAISELLHSSLLQFNSSLYLLFNQLSVFFLLSLFLE